MSPSGQGPCPDAVLIWPASPASAVSDRQAAAKANARPTFAIGIAIGVHHDAWERQRCHGDRHEGGVDLGRPLLLLEVGNGDEEGSRDLARSEEGGGVGNRESSKRVRDDQGRFAAAETASTSAATHWVRTG